MADLGACLRFLPTLKEAGVKTAKLKEHFTDNQIEAAEGLVVSVLGVG